jgi:hypothetical protein
MIHDLARYSSSAAERSKVVKLGECWLKEVVMANLSAGTRYLQVFDAATVPADAAVPIFTLNIATLTAGAWEPAEPVKLESGLVVVASSTLGTKTVVVADDALFTVLYAERR